MLNLDDSKIPEYTFQFEGEQRTFDPLALAFAAESLVSERNPEVICQALQKVTKLKFSSLQAIVLMRDVLEFVEKHAGETLKNSSSQSPSSTIITDSPLENLEDLPIENISDSSETFQPSDDSEHSNSVPDSQ